MDNKRLILLMALGMVLILGWPLMINRVGTMLGYDMTVRPPATQPAGPTDATPVTPALAPTVGATTATAGGPATISNGIAGYATLPSTRPVAGVALGSKAPEDKTFALGVETSPIGAGLNEVVINDYKLNLRTGEPFAYERPGAKFPNRTRALAVRAVTIDGVDVDLTGQQWGLVSSDDDASDGNVAVTYELTVARDGAPALTLQRQYTVFTRAGGDYDLNGAKFQPLGFEVRVRNAFRNHTGQPMAVALKYNGQGVPPSESERYIDAFYVVATGLDGKVVAHGTSATGTGATPTDLLAGYKDSGETWYVGALTSYFVALQRFEPPEGAKAPADRFASVTATALTPDDHTVTRETELIVATKPIAVPAGGESSFASRLYFGPKKREFLTNSHYMQDWIRYDASLVPSTQWWICMICTWQWLIDILFVVLKAFHFITRDWGLAIVGLTCLVRVCLHPITKRAQMNMLKFGKLAPEMERIKKKHANDQEAMNRAMMQFYKEHGSTQLMGCLPMFLQMPIWIALWQAMNTTFELRHQPFFYGLTWIDDLSKPDHLIEFGHSFTLPLLSFVVISGFNILPLLFGFLQFLQFKIQPKPPSLTEEQRQQQAMTQWMMLIIFPIMMYASPSGLMIYMITSFTIGILESKLVKKQFEAQQEHEARFTVVDEDSPAAAVAEKATVRRKQEPAGPKKKGLMGMLEEARRRAEEMQKEIEKNRKRGK